ncbi:MAG: arylsulfatase [Carboxylicivirga sp.]|jgi:arylsulfatase A-like enzyme|nr:arylsulfatase [Carboxylicivirga sp.]
MMKYILSIILILFLFSCENRTAQKPNVVIIYADDMGYGDVSCQNPNSKIHTPNIDNLAETGVRFTDAHSSSGICSPSRYALLTGKYHWRTQHNIVKSFEPPMFKDYDITLPQVLKKNGYNTACIGKWHLGWDWEFKGEPSGLIKKKDKNIPYYQCADIDWGEGIISGGPLDRGFNYYFGDGTINFPPYAWIENDKLLQIPTQNLDLGYKKTAEGSWEFRPGPMVKDWDPMVILNTLTNKAKAWISKQSKEQPFFLYFALPSPHAPIIPNKKFHNTSQAGGYGDYVVQTDDVVGQVMSLLDEHGFGDNTIVIFTSDNGPETYAYNRAKTYGHYSSGEYRGLKRDVWEGGHHVPFIITWRNGIEEKVSNKLVSQSDLMATICELTDATLPNASAPDSYSFASHLIGEGSENERETLIHNTYIDKWAIRKGKWLYINSNTGAHWNEPKFYKALRGYADFETEGLLFNMDNDKGQLINLHDTYPAIVDELKRELDKQRSVSDN